MRAITYERVSSDEQTNNYSIETQNEANRKYASKHSFEVVRDFVDSGISGSTLDRPALSELREFVKSGQADLVIAYDLDRLSRNLAHLMVLLDEFEKLGVNLQFVTQSVGKTPEERMLFGMKGLFAEYERTKTMERTQRGIRQRAKMGKFPSGIRARLYGYSYLSGSGIGEGKRYVNEAEAKIVRDIFEWFIGEGMSIRTIKLRLEGMAILTASGNSIWQRSQVWRILQNSAYIGETFVFTMTFKSPNTRTRKARPKEEWVSLPGLTPPIIDKEVFEQAQLRLKRNFEKASRNTKHDYLLSGYIKCSVCGHRYWGYVRYDYKPGKRYLHRFYHCPNCGNQYNAEALEGAVWAEVEKVLTNPEVLLAELDRRKGEASTSSKQLMERELTNIARQLKSLDTDQRELLHHAIQGFPDELVKSENERINQRRSQLIAQQSDIENKIASITQAAQDMAGVEEFCKLASKNLENFSFADKRLALEALAIEVKIDGANVYLTGAIPVCEVESIPSYW